MNASPLNEGTQIPEFETEDETGAIYSNQTIQGQLTLLYFYPRDNTPGCTLQACDLRDSYKNLLEIPVLVLGISGCSCSSHQKFKTKYSLPFPLLLDEDHQIAQLFGVWGEKKFMGKTFDGIHRTSFIINKTGEILKTYKKVKPKVHLEEVMKDLLEIQKTML